MNRTQTRNRQRDEEDRDNERETEFIVRETKIMRRHATEDHLQLV